MRMRARNYETGRMEYETVTLEYDPADPLAVKFAFVGLDAKPWHFARDLLAAGLVEHVGYGDVRLWRVGGPRGDVLNVVLRGTNFDGFLELPAADVQRFLDRTYRQVPRGAEADHIDLDHLVSRLLAETP
jgi:hypothetical protein